MKPPLRRVPWFRPAADFHRPSRRVQVKRQRWPLEWRPDSFIERAEIWLWQHPWIRPALAFLIFGFMGVCLAIWIWRAS